MVHGRILELLKEGTAAQHEAAERRVDLKHRLRDQSSYAALLGRFYGFYAPLETELGRIKEYHSIDLDFDARRKTPLLVRDLTTLGTDLDSFPYCTDLPDVKSLGDALGVMYVLEGATLGGRFITRAVESQLGLTPTCGSAFFASYGAQVSTMWESFRAALVRFATSSRTEMEVLTTATSTFDRLDRWLAQLDAGETQ